MSKKMNRRSFVKKSALASAATMVGLSFQERTLSAKTLDNEAARAAGSSNTGMPMGRIGKVVWSNTIKKEVESCRSSGS